MKSDNRNIVPDTANFQSKPRIVFLWYTLEPGGIQTLFIRLAKQLSDADYKVTIAAPTGPLDKLIEKNIDRIYEFSVENIIANQGFSQEKIVIFCGNQWGSLHALDFCRKNQNAHILLGVFHPFAFASKHYSFHYALFNRLIFCALADENIFFMSDAVKKWHELTWRKNLDDIKVWRLSVNNNNNAAWKPRKSEDFKILTIGRLVPDKQHILNAPDIIQHLVEKGVDASWTIYGDGPLRSQLVSRIDVMGLTARVIVAGNLDYSKFYEEVCKHDVFVGMGTSLLEAATIGIPSLLAVIGHRDVCAGWYGEIEGDFLGEHADWLQYYPYKQVISELALAKKNPQALSEACIRKASVYNSSFEELEAIIESASTTKSSIRLDIIRYIAIIFGRLIGLNKPPDP